MKDIKKTIAFLALLIILFAIFSFDRRSFLPLFIPLVFAHCDTMGGPVIQAAQKALETGNIDLVLMWVQEKDDAEIRETFQKTLAVRKLNPQAKDLADKYFFETLVRVHRAGEGAPYMGLKFTEEEVEPSIIAADKAVEYGSADNLIEELSSEVADGIRQRFSVLVEKKKHMYESVRAGREYVKAYVTFIHYVEKLYLDVSAKTVHQGEVEGISSEGHHKH